MFPNLSFSSALLPLMPSWINTDDGLIFHHFSSSQILVKVVGKSGSCYTSAQNNEDLTYICRLHNPQLNLSETGIITILKDAFSNPANFSVSEEKLKVSNLLEKLKYSLSFNWEFDLSPCSNTIDEIFNPIFTTMMLLIEEKNALESLIKKKDKEISEFKSLGINLSKKSKLSAPYDHCRTLKSITASTRSTSEILSNTQFKEVVCKSYESENTATTRSPVKKKKLAPVGITFEDSQSQPDQVFTDADIFPTSTLKDDHDSGEIKNEQFSTKVEDSNSHAAKPAVPVMKKKKPRRL